MTSKKIFSDLRKELETKDAIREDIIIKSRPIVKNSKKAIYAVHRNSLKEAKKYLKDAAADLKKLTKDLTIHSYRAALQEYTEAVCYYSIITENKLISNVELGINAEDYLLGICDLTGELCRRAVFSVVNDNFSDVKKVKKFVEFIYNEFLQLNLRNSELRKKSDSIKWNLKKIEEILYDLKIRGYNAV